MPAYKNTLRYKHMVARLEKLPFYKLETAVHAEIAKGKRWRTEAAIEALSKHEDRFNYVNYGGLLEACGRFGRLTAIHRLADVYKWEKAKHEHSPSPHGAPEAFDMAVIHGHYRVAEFCRRYGAQPDVMIHRDRPQRAMAIAVNDTDIKKIVYLLKSGASASYHLPKAVQDGNLELAKLFLDAGADVNMKAQGHWTPLHLAARKGDLPMVDLLIERGALIESCANDLVYDLIASYKSFAVFERMLELGAKPDNRDLEHAVAEGLINYTERLLQTGLRITPEMLVHAIGHHKSNPEMIDLCLKNGVDPKNSLQWLESHPNSIVTVRPVRVKK